MVFGAMAAAFGDPVGRYGGQILTGIRWAGGKRLKVY